MEVKIEEIDGKYVVTFNGEMDTLASADVEKKLQPFYKSDGKDIIFDCKHLDYIASSGLRILVGILKAARQTGSHVVLRSISSDIREVLTLMGLINIFEIS